MVCQSWNAYDLHLASPERTGHLNHSIKTDKLVSPLQIFIFPVCLHPHPCPFALQIVIWDPMLQLDTTSRPFTPFQPVLIAQSYFPWNKTFLMRLKSTNQLVISVEYHSILVCRCFMCSTNITRFLQECPRNDAELFSAEPIKKCMLWTGLLLVLLILGLVKVICSVCIVNLPSYLVVESRWKHADILLAPNSSYSCSSYCFIICIFVIISFPKFLLLFKKVFQIGRSVTRVALNSLCSQEWPWALILLPLLLSAETVDMHHQVYFYAVLGMNQVTMHARASPFPLQCS